ncbi:MAG: hypothetical protein NC241_00210 [Bacteroides sp.]|nr:hypothetical protein [Bacteroides sp.]MCM1456703.1 hypothetical protein [Lachnoclostridium sp.]
MKKIISLLSIILVSTATAMAANEADSISTGKKLVENSKEAIGSAAKKVSGMFGKIKDKAKDKLGSHKSDEPKDNTSELKKIKIKDELGSYDYFILPKDFKFKSDEKKELPFKISVYVDLKDPDKKKYYRFEYFFYCFNQVTIPKGAQVLIRTGNDKVYKAQTVKEYSNTASTGATYKFNPVSNKSEITGVETSWSDLNILYVLEDGAFEDMVEHGVKKIRLGASDDYNFSEDRFEKLHTFLKNYNYSVNLKSERIKNYTPPAVRQTQQTIPDF